MKDLYTYVIGVEPNDWTFNDTKACKRYGITCKGYYVLGDNEGMVLVGTLSDIENFVENYFGAGIAKDYLCPYDMFDFEDGKWITGGWFESKKSNKESLKERYEYKVDEITDIIRSNNYGLNYSCNILDEYAFDIERGKIDWLSKNAYNEISIAYANCVQYLRDEYDGKKKDELIDDLTKFFDKVITLTESKKSARKSLKEEKATDSLFEDVVFSMIKKFKLKKEYYVERPSWTVFNFRHKNKDAQFAIYFDKRYYGDFYMEMF